MKKKKTYNEKIVDRKRRIESLIEESANIAPGKKIATTRTIEEQRFMTVDLKRDQMIRLKKKKVMKCFEGTLGNGAFLKFVEVDNKKTLKDLT